MSKVNVTTFLAAFLLVATGSPAEAAKSAFETGLSIGKKRGYSNPDCYATVFAAYAAQGADAKFKGPKGKAATLYKGELFSKCNISR